MAKTTHSTRYSIAQRGLNLNGEEVWSMHGPDFYIGTIKRRKEAGLKHTPDRKSLSDMKKVLAYARNKWPNLTFRLIRFQTKKTWLDV